MNAAGTKVLQRIRERYHPLWRLRRWAPFRRLQHACDFAVKRRIGRVTRYSMLLRDFSILIERLETEPRTSAMLECLFKKARLDCFIDIGANLGQYSWRVANIKPEAKLLLFEPDPVNAKMIRKSIAHSALTNAKLYPVALSDTAGAARFIVDDLSGAVGSIVDQRGSGFNLQDSYRLSKETTVPTRRLDEFFAEIDGRRILMKVDVEGAEALVFQGARRVLSESKPIVIFESFEGAGLDSLREVGYRIFSIEENSNYLAIASDQVNLIDGMSLPEV